jgi:plasmid stabilization system protein ParE
MPKGSILVAESAVADLEEFRNWYSEQGVPDTGAKNVAEIFEKVEALRDQPAMGRIVAEFDQHFLRELIHLPFRIVYLREPSRVRVVRLWRSEKLLRLP